MHTLVRCLCDRTVDFKRFKAYIFWTTLLTRVCTCSVINILDCITTSNIFKELTRTKPSVKGGPGKWLCWCLKIISLDFWEFKRRLLFTSQRLILSSSVWIDNVLEAGTIRYTSSAYLRFYYQGWQHEGQKHKW